MKSLLAILVCFFLVSCGDQKPTEKITNGQKSGGESTNDQKSNKVNKEIGTTTKISSDNFALRKPEFWKKYFEFLKDRNEKKESFKDYKVICYYNGNADTGIGVECYKNNTRIWYTVIMPLGTSHSFYKQEVKIGFNKGRIQIISVGSHGTIEEDLILETGYQYSRQIHEN